MAESSWYPMPPKKRKRPPVVKCDCCEEVKPRDGQRPCLACQDAKCEFNCGVWKHGAECPKRLRTKRKTKSGIAIRKKLDRFG
jgi:hypothetical protein